jgi:hypothetical protein
LGFALQHEPLVRDRIDGAKTLPIPELVKRTARLSAFEDFKARSLSALSGRWGKLLYMAELLGKDFSYEHWGHSRVHGEACSQAALGKIHSEIYIEVLRTSIVDLTGKDELESDQDRNALSERIASLASRMIPKELNGGSTRHFNSILLIVRLLCAERRASNRSVA